VSVDVIDDLLAVDGVRPGQFSELWAATAERTGEQMLALAVLEQAVEDLGRYRGARRPDHQRIFDSTYRWLTSNDRTWPYSFTSICDLLDLPVEPLRAHLVDNRVATGIVSRDELHAAVELASLRARA
jgi:hypothetical protein